VFTFVKPECMLSKNNSVTAFCRQLPFTCQSWGLSVLLSLIKFIKDVTVLCGSIQFHNFSKIYFNLGDFRLKGKKGKVVPVLN
jgi:hypothetical protein